MHLVTWSILASALLLPCAWNSVRRSVRLLSSGPVAVHPGSRLPCSAQLWAPGAPPGKEPQLLDGLEPGPPDLPALGHWTGHPPASVSVTTHPARASPWLSLCPRGPSPMPPTFPASQPTAPALCQDISIPNSDAVPHFSASLSPPLFSLAPQTPQNPPFQRQDLRPSKKAQGSLPQEEGHHPDSTLRVPQRVRTLSRGHVSRVSLW